MLRRVVGSIRFLNRVGHYFAGAALLAMLALTVVDIVGRSLFNSPLSGTVEVTPLLLVVVVYLGFAHAEHQGDHVSVDLVYTRVGPRAQRVADLVARSVSLVVLGVVTWQLWRYAGVQEAGGYTTAVLEWEIHWFVRIAALGAALLWLATLVEIVAVVARLDRQVSAGPLTPGGGLREGSAP